MNTLFTVSRICELPNYSSSTEAINRCHDGKSWSIKEVATKKFSFLSNMFESFTTEFLLRTPRFVISGAVIIATAIGAASVAAPVLTAGLIAKNEGNHIAAEQRQLRAIDTKNNIYNDFVNYNISLAKDIDNIRYNSAVSAKIVYSCHNKS